MQENNSGKTICTSISANILAGPCSSTSAPTKTDSALILINSCASIPQRPVALFRFP
jgi:hypothetical protein